MTVLKVILLCNGKTGLGPFFFLIKLKNTPGNLMKDDFLGA